MKTEISSLFPDVASPLVERFQDLQDALHAFSVEAAEFHKGLAVADDASRALFTALSRITAYSDQMHMVLNLMTEDMRVTEEIGTAPSMDFESVEDENCFYEWLRRSRKGGVTVN
ncbi:MAG TPA: hypothetical protein VMU71_07295 [Terracidiphilus sp.]|nr:hypothetical protein [Terracidiphilus sp.]